MDFRVAPCWGRIGGTTPGFESRRHTMNPSTSPRPADDEPIRVPAAILEAQAAFERDLPRLLKERPGQWVAYRPEGPVLFAATSVELHQECWRRGYDEIVTRCIEPYPEEDFISGW